MRRVRVDADCAALALAVGKRDALVAAVGVTEPHLAREIEAALDATEKA